jgi:L-rhamnose mutarotase
MEEGQLINIFLAISPSLLKVSFFVGFVWLFIQWGKEAKYSNEHGWLWESYSASLKKHITKKFSIFWPMVLLIICAVWYIIEVVFIKHQLH